VYGEDEEMALYPSQTGALQQYRLVRKHDIMQRKGLFTAHQCWSTHYSGVQHNAMHCSAVSTVASVSSGHKYGTVQERPYRVHTV
jgi:hypothetical protein